MENDLTLQGVERLRQLVAMKRETALILCEGLYGQTVAKTAAGLVRHSERFRILGVLDSTHAGSDAGTVLDGVERGIPVFSGMDEAMRQLADAGERPDWLIVGVATVGGRLPPAFRRSIREALEAGMGVMSGLHEFLGDDPEFSSLAERTGARIVDVRRPPPLDESHSFGNLAKDIPALRIPVLGTDSAIGKRTTAVELVRELNSRGVKSVMVATGQTGLMLGARYGIPLDSIKGDYMVGELENQIMLAYREEKPDVIVIEGQGALSHPAYVCGSRAIVMASCPSGIVLQHAPDRRYRNYHRAELMLPMPDIASEVKLAEFLSGARVLAITLNHENMDPGTLEETVRAYEEKFGIPCADVLAQGAGKVADAVLRLQKGD